MDRAGRRLLLIVSFEHFSHCLFTDNYLPGGEMWNFLIVFFADFFLWIDR
jgi:hypothetical protein